MRPLQRITHIAILTALSLILFVLEGFLPLPLPVPGAKLGLAAVATLVAEGTAQLVYGTHAAHHQAFEV